MYAAAVVLEQFSTIDGLADSKQLSAKRRAQLDIEIRRRAVSYCIAEASIEEIDTLNILGASMLAMERAVAGIEVPIEFAVIDGNRLPKLVCVAEWLVKGDSKSDSIKAASIIAKVARDAEMERLDALYPEYGLAQHKGYPTAQHLKALTEYGPSPIHRMSFGPCFRSVKVQDQ